MILLCFKRSDLYYVLVQFVLVLYKKKFGEEKKRGEGFEDRIVDVSVRLSVRVRVREGEGEGNVA